MMGKGTVMLPLDVELLVIPPWAPVAAIIEAAFFWLVQATNYPNGDISVRCGFGVYGEHTYSAIGPDLRKCEA
jgi:hypothetical protein